MNFRDWYTDRMDIYRVEPVRDGALTRHERRKIAEDIPCRVYQTDAARLELNQTAAASAQKDWVQCDNSVDVQAGDELRIFRGKGLGKALPEIRAFAADPNHFFEPFGAVLPGLAHQEIPLLQEERVKGGMTGDAEGTGGADESTPGQAPRTAGERH